MSDEASNDSSDGNRKRVFFAYVPNAATKAVLHDAVETVTGCDATRMRWLEADNWHVTLRFVGDVATEMVEHLASGLGDVAAHHEAFAMPLTAIDVFPSSRKPRVLAALGVPDERSIALVDALQALCAGLGLAAESRPWRPHLTFARIRGSKTLEFEAHALNTVCSVQELVLLQSVAGERGRDYIRIAHATLRDAVA